MKNIRILRPNWNGMPLTNDIAAFPTIVGIQTPGAVTKGHRQSISSPQVARHRTAPRLTFRGHETPRAEAISLQPRDSHRPKGLPEA
jgi:hypothetical protein